MSRRAFIARGGPATCATLLLTLAARAFVDGPVPGVTGGFGEPTCQQCHFDNPVDDPGGRLTLSGVPPAYQPGERYAIELALNRPGVSRGGFQMAVRFASGPDAGRQAGILRAADDRVQVVNDAARAVSYAQHTSAGSRSRIAGKLRWTLAWLAPAHAAGPVIFHVAANAANGDDSPLGDFVYLAEARTEARR